MRMPTKRFASIVAAAVLAGTMVVGVGTIVSAGASTHAPAAASTRAAVSPVGSYAYNDSEGTGPAVLTLNADQTLTLVGSGGLSCTGIWLALKTTVAFNLEQSSTCAPYSYIGKDAKHGFSSGTGWDQNGSVALTFTATR